MNEVSTTRQELLAALDELSRLFPDWRLGQTTANLATTAGRMDAGGVWDLEDDEALAAAKKLIADGRRRIQDKAQATGVIDESSAATRR